MLRNSPGSRWFAGTLLALLAACSGEAPVTTDAPVEAVPVVAAAPEKSIAVLPFADLSELGDQEYFSDGLSEYLIDTLSMMPDLQVAPRDASFHYKDRNVVLNEVGAALGVAHILQGSVRKSGAQLRVSAQLVNAATGFNIWASTFDRELADVFAIQNEITEAVTTALSVTLGAGRFSVPGMTREVAAYDKALQAFATYNLFTPDSVFRALNLAEEAVRIDPQYGRAWLLMGSIYTDSPLILSADQSADFPALASNAFEQARSLAPDMPELLIVDARQYREAGNFAEAERIYQLYFEQYRNASARAMEEYAQLMSTTGRIDEAVTWLERAKSQEPFEPRYSFQLAMHLLYADRIPEALAEADYGLTLDGNKWLFHSIGWQAALKQGDTVRAAELMRAYYANDSAAGDDTVSQRFMMDLSAILLTNDFAASAGDVIALIQSPSVTPVELSYLARLAAQMGQPDVALDYWFGENISPAIWDSFYADMRKLPEFKTLMQEKGLVDFWRNSGNWGDHCRPLNDDFECF
jgi:TolB-like protein/Flp pilus assembly protein TadD